MNIKKLKTAREKLTNSISAFELERVKYQTVLDSATIKFSEDIAQDRISRAKALDLTLDTSTADEEVKRQDSLRKDAEIQVKAKREAETAIGIIDRNLKIFRDQLNEIDIQIESAVSDMASNLYQEKRDRFFSEMSSALSTLVEAGALYKLSRKGFTPSVDSVVIPRMEAVFLDGFINGPNQTFRVSGEEIKGRINNRFYSMKEELANG